MYGDTWRLGLRAYKYESLLDLPYFEIVEITAMAEPFKIIAEGKVGRRIIQFLKNEKVFAESNRSLMNRLRYVAGGFRGILAPNFMPLWNRAMMDGFIVESIEQSGPTYEIIFSKPDRRS